MKWVTITDRVHGNWSLPRAHVDAVKTLIGEVCQGISARSAAATGMNQRLLIHSSIRGNIPEGRKIRARPYDGNWVRPPRSSSWAVRLGHNTECCDMGFYKQRSRCQVNLPIAVNLRALLRAPFMKRNQQNLHPFSPHNGSAIVVASNALQ